MTRPTPFPRRLPVALLLLAGCLTAPGGLLAQGDLEDNTVTVLSSFQANLDDAERILVQPSPPPADTSRRRQQYSVTARPLNIDYPAPVIRPRALGRDKTDEPHNGFARVGVGVPNQFFGDLSYDLTDLDNVDLGLFASHYSFNNNGKVENQRSSDTRLGTEAAYLFDQGFTVGVGAAYETRSRYYYGYNFPLEGSEDTTDVSFTQDEVRQRFNIFDIHGEIFNGTRTQGDFDYHAGAKLYLMDANPAVRESGVDLEVAATKWIDGKHPIDFRVDADFTSYKDTVTQSLNNFSLEGAYTTSLDNRIRLRIGARATNQSRTSDFDLFPDVSVSAPIIDGVLSAFAGIEGGLYKNTLRSLTDYNPWVRLRLRVRTSEYVNYHGGVEGTLYGIAYRAEVGYKDLDNIALYQLIQDRVDPQFRVLYDDGSVTTFQGSATLPVVENLDLSATVAQRFYSLENEEKPWHLPSFSLNAAGIYSFVNYPLKVRGDFFLENGLPFRNAAGEADNLNALLDLSLSVDYQLTDHLALWGRVNNLLNNQRQRFARYPTLGTNFLVGVSTHF